MIAALTALITALSGLIVAIAVMLGVLMGRAKKTNNLVNGHFTRLVDILSQADVTLPDGGIIHYVPPNMQTEEQKTIQWLEEMKQS